MRKEREAVSAEVFFGKPFWALECCLLSTRATSFQSLARGLLQCLQMAELFKPYERNSNPAPAT